MDATDEALSAGFWTDLFAEFEGGARALSLDGEGGAARLDEDDGTGARPDIEVVVHGCQDVAFPAEILVHETARRPCTSLSALQAR